MLVEVNDVTSAGLRGSGMHQYAAEELWEQLCSKALAVKQAGFRFRLIVFLHQRKLVLPKGWNRYSYAEIIEWHKGVKKRNQNRATR